METLDPHGWMLSLISVLVVFSALVQFSVSKGAATPAGVQEATVRDGRSALQAIMITHAGHAATVWPEPPGALPVSGNRRNKRYKSRKGFDTPPPDKSRKAIYSTNLPLSGRELRGG